MALSFNKQMLTLQQVADYLRVTPNTVKNYIQAGKFRAFDFGKGKGRHQYRVHPQDLETFLDKSRTNR